MRLADLARKHHDPTVTLLSAITGQYIEAGVSFVLHAFGTPHSHT